MCKEVVQLPTCAKCFFISSTKSGQARASTGKQALVKTHLHLIWAREISVLS